MGINRQSDESANLQVGPTTEGMVRIYVAAETVDLPLDFTPEDAEEIARELLAAAEAVKNGRQSPPLRSGSGAGAGKRHGPGAKTGAGKPAAPRSHRRPGGPASRPPQGGRGRPRRPV